MSIRKGRVFENKVASELDSVSPARRVSVLGLSGPDVLFMDRFIECKWYQKYKSVKFYTGLLQDDNHIVAFKQDLGDTYVLMRLTEFADIVEEARNE